MFLGFHPPSPHPSLKLLPSRVALWRDKTEGTARLWRDKMVGTSAGFAPLREIISPGVDVGLGSGLGSVLNGTYLRGVFIIM